MASPDSDPRIVRRWLALGMATGFAVLLAALVSRSLAAVVSLSLAAWQAAALTALGCAVTMLAWRLDDEDRAGDDAPARLARAAVALIAALIFGLLLARSSTAGAVAVGSVVMIWATAAIIRVLELKEPLLAALAMAQDATRTRFRSAIGSLHDAVGSPRQSANSVTETNIAPQALSSDVRFQLQRRSGPEGEAIDIQARLEFPAGAVESVLHVPFWPALATDPNVECEPLDADDVQLRVTAAERYGIRLEARLPAATSAPRTVLIGIEIHAAAADDDNLSAAA